MTRALMRVGLLLGAVCLVHTPSHAQGGAPAAGAAPGAGGSATKPSGTGALGSSDAKPDPATAPIDPAGLDISKLRLVQPPAQVLLGSSFTVQTPGTPQELAASLISGAGSGGNVPNGFAIETSPFWLTSASRTIRTSDYRKNDVANVVRRLSVSVAATRGDSTAGSVAPAASVGIGMRTLLWDTFRPMPDTALATYIAIATYSRLTADTTAARRVIARQDSLAKPHRARLAQLSVWVSRAIERLAATDPAQAAAARIALRDSLDARDRTADSVTFYNDTIATITARDKQERDSLVGVAKRRTDAINAYVSDASQIGFRLELAAGGRGRFPDGRWQSARWDGIGLWLTPSYRGQGWQLSGIGRYLTRVQDYAGQNVLDGGGRVDLIHGNLTLSFEAVARGVGKADANASTSDGVTVLRIRHAARYTGGAQYRITNGTLLVASFGSDFARENKDRPVISSLGLTFGFGSISLQQDPPAKKP